ncbi:bis-aminopropyl spermidine synthase family protein [Novosphingopyxis sp.]|uniref:bis-aminopropyl spermidine synthase family protein n=1 Tax=Novosphingopyxis sp. TaxID=2709690 RepID=UPI003B59B5C1
MRAAVNAVSDVVANRTRPLREFDQIHMKTGDMVMQSEAIASWSKEKRLAFIGDGDAVSVALAYLKERKVLDFGPTKIMVFDFDERTVNAVKRFADKERLDYLDATLYNVLDPLPDVQKYDCFYTNPPWGASNGGASVNAFVQRGIEAVRYDGEGCVVIADDDELDWPKQVLANVQSYASSRGFYVSRMARKLHGYHLDDAPDLKSCNLFFSSVPGNIVNAEESAPLTNQQSLRNFYGGSKEPRVRYVREMKRPDYGKAPQEEYRLELFDHRSEEA